MSKTRASSTTSRLENLASWRQLARIGPGMIDVFVKSFPTAPREIILDIDDTDDPVHGQQEPPSCVPSMFDSLGVQVPCPT